MNIIRTSRVESCLDGSATMEYLLDSAVTKAFIDYLRDAGISEYYPRFSRPFFRIKRPGCFVMKGVEGDATIQVVYNTSPGAFESEIISRIMNYSADERSIQPSFSL